MNNLGQIQSRPTAIIFYKRVKPEPFFREQVTELGACITSLAYAEVVVTGETPAPESAFLNAGVASLNYVPNVIDGAAQSDSGTLTAGIGAFAYAAVVIEGAAHADAGTLTAAINSISYVETVFVAGTESDTGFLAAGISSFSYAIA